MRTAARPEASLEDRLGALEEALSLADGRLDPAIVERGRTILARAGERLRLGPHLTVAALAGATGSGKSSLFNALAGDELSPVGVRRPTTGVVQAAVWGDDPADALLDWLAAGRRHRRSDPALDGLILLDLPDHDSTHSSHRLEVDRLVELVDLFVWVVDPQKYADALLHQRYLRPLAAFAPVTLVALNQVDRLDRDQREACATDLRRLLEADGLSSAEVVLTSARTGEGVGDLRELIERRVAARREALRRLAADLDTILTELEGCCAPDSPSRGMRADERGALVDALSAAAGVDAVTRAVARAYRHRAGLATGWPLTRWLRRLRPDPLRRFHLDVGRDEGSTSLPPATPVQRAQVDSALRAVAEDASSGLTGPWPARLRTVALASSSELPRELDRAVTSTDLGMKRRPLWWSVVGLLQTLFLLVAAAGGLWLAGLFGFAYLRLPEPPVPEVGRFPLPTLMLIGGLVAGALLALISRLIAGGGAARRAVAARRRLRAAVGTVAQRRVLAAIEIELEAHDRLCAALRRARATPARRFLSR